MDKEVMRFEVNKATCEAYGCFETATTKINVKVGDLGSICLDVCASCIRKFVYENADLKQKIVRNEKETVIER